jgi:hypothetical protein
MLGYMGKQEAKAIGFTHQGRYFGIPLWITNSQRPMIVAKWYPMELMVTLLQQSEIYVKLKLFPRKKHLHQLTNVKAIGS